VDRRAQQHWHAGDDARLSVAALTRFLPITLVLTGCASEVSIEARDGREGPAETAGAGGADALGRLPLDLEAYCRTRLTMRALRLGCDAPKEGHVGSCVGQLESASRVDCLEEALALYECAAERSSRCDGITTGCNYEENAWRQACWPMGEGGAGGAP
jgi:hypothetical protein